MSYIGPVPEFGELHTQILPADSVTLTFTLDYYVPSSNSVLVMYGGVPQQPVVVFNAFGNSITFTEAPVTGVLTYVVFLGRTLEVPTPADDSVTFAKVAADAIITTAPEQPTTSGIEFDFLSIPSGVKKVTIMFNEVSLDGYDDLLIQLGYSGGIETSSYTSTSTGTNGNTGSVVSSGNGFILQVGNPSNAGAGHMVLTRMNDSHLWISSHSGLSHSTVSIFGGGSKVLSGGELSQIRITRTGTDSFDGGSIGILYEGK